MAHRKKVMGVWGILFFILIEHTSAQAQPWLYMQEKYKQLCQIFNNHMTDLELLFMHPYWQVQRKNLAALLQKKEDHQLLMRGPIAGPMVRRGWGKAQEYEVLYLQSCITQETQQLLSKFKDTSFGGIPRECTQFNCSINALGQLFFFAKILELFSTKNIKTIVEIGGGYGCLARIAKMVLQDSTYIIFDLPEYLALQCFYLQSTLPGVAVELHTSIPSRQLTQGVIHLIPIFFIPEMQCETDIFISTAALSETTAAVQQMVVEKQFFRAQLAYLTGQLNKWGIHYNFEHQHIIFEGMRSCYPLCYAQPLHHFDGILNCYEIYGIKNE